MSDDQLPAQRRLKRRALLGLAATATGSAIVAWQARGGDQPPQTDADLTGHATPPPDARGTSANDSTPEAASGVIAEVGEEGFDITFGSVHVFAPAGVAAIGTPISVTSITEPPSPELLALAGAIGPRVVIELVDGKQPQQPITIEVNLAGTELANDVSDEAPLVALSRTESEESLLLLDGTWDAERETFTVVTDHLSPFEFFQFDLQQFVADLLLDLVDARFPRPDRAYEPLTIGNTTYSVDQASNLAVWPVFKNQRGQAAVELHSNSPLPWAVQTTPSVIGSVSGHYTDRNIGIAAYYQGLHSIFGNERTAVMPGTVATFQFSKSVPPASMSLKIDQGLFVVTSVLWVFESILALLASTPKARALLATYEGLSCVIDIVKTPDQIEENRNFTGLVRSTASCIGTLVEENAGKLGSRFFVRTVATVVGIIIGGAAVIAAAVANVLLTVSGNNTFALTFHASSVGASATGPVAMKQGNAARTGGLPGPGPSLNAPIALKWKFESEYWLVGYPAVVDGSVYIACHQYDFLALDAATGRERWRIRKDDGGHHDGPAVSHGLILTGNWDETFTAYDADSGQERWRMNLTASLSESSPVVADDTVYFGCWDGNLYALDITSGDEHWRYHTTEGILSSPAVADGIVYVGSRDTNVHAVDTSTGKSVWRFGTGDWVNSSPTVVNGVVYVGSRDTNLYAIDAVSGEEIWRYGMGQSMGTSVAVANGVIYASGFDGQVVALEAASGANLWSVGTRGPLFTDPIVVDGVVYVHSQHTPEDTFHAIDASSGEELWHFTPEAATTTVPATTCTVIDGVIYVGHNETLYAFENAQQSVLAADVTLRGAPSMTAVERGSANAGDSIDYVGTQDNRSGVAWAEVTINGATGWIPLEAIDPATLLPEGDIEYVYVP